MALRPVKNLIVVSDLHVGCQMGLVSPTGAALDHGGTYEPSGIQKKLYAWWREMWDEWVPKVTKGETYAVVVNGDCVDGVHHGSTSQWTHNLACQSAEARRLLDPIAKRAKGGFYVVRGTEAHVGASARDEEQLASELGAIPSKSGNHARWELWKWCGPSLVHFLHHIGSTSSQAHEASAVNAELTTAFVEAGRWGRRPPDMIVRSHRHRYIEVVVPTAAGRAYAVVTPAWQFKTGFAYRTAGARNSESQIGAICIRHAHGQTFVVPWVRSLDREDPE